MSLFSVTAVRAGSEKVRILEGKYYHTLQSAYDETIDNSIIQVQNGTYTEDLYIDRPVSVILEGSYKRAFLPESGVVVLYGDVIISNGTLEISDFRLEH